MNFQTILNWAGNNILLVLLGVIAVILFLILIFKKRKEVPKEEIERMNQEWSRPYQEYNTTQSYPNQSYSPEKYPNAFKKEKDELAEAMSKLRKMLPKEELEKIDRDRRPTRPGIRPLTKNIKSSEDYHIQPRSLEDDKSFQRLREEDNLGKKFTPSLTCPEKSSSSNFWKVFAICLIIVIIIGIAFLSWGIRNDKFKSFSNLLCGNTTIQPTQCTNTCPTISIPNCNCPECNLTCPTVNVFTNHS